MGALAASKRTDGADLPVIPRGTVLLPVGDKFAGTIDMLTHDWFKALPVIRGFSPVRFGKKRQLRLSAQLADAHADYLVVDNTTALASIGEMEPSRRWRRRYDAFVATCLEHFPADRIILVRSHASRLWLDDKLEPAPTVATAEQARVLAELDDYFITKTSCRVSDVALRHFPVGPDAFVFDKSMASDLERDIVRLCSTQPRRRPFALGTVFHRSAASLSTWPVVADTIVSRVTEGASVDAAEVAERLSGSADATWDDLIAL
ncbi:MAG: hypothetical protein PV358_16740, partial [Acidimicrobiales bacterium]|nr:hypothetical protein [Acidimicrobiales bacterium]